MSSEWSGSVVAKETQVVKNEKRRRVDNQIVLALLRPESVAVGALAHEAARVHAVSDF